MPFLIWFMGKVYVLSGSMIENCGNNFSFLTANFSCVDSLEITQPQFISEPVAGNVMTAPIGKTS